ncbi:transmembrane protein KIAA1109 homolog isoform X3 [Homalodisca vitripennis]|uniref:transmembrane protein KIAA1109 homolog isoform X3 n=1 Tax=Homalodisca vitripennis TaxID=197043 RepID=UPI001EECC10B|nr:transmembrane protein KIAA1109 homolog isoform X3 [Homalodisca vitripennis]
MTNSTAVTMELIPTTEEVLSTTSASFIETINQNYTNVSLEDIRMDSTFAMLLCSFLFAMTWVIYITYYNSRVAGYFITKALNRFFVSEGYAKVGSFTLCALSGKIMFRDIIYITHDYSVRVQDGWMIFRWWRAYVPKDVSEDLSHSDTRLSVMLNGFELHFYNRSAVYGHLERVFGLDPVLFPWDASLFRHSDEREAHDPGGSRPRPQPGAGSLGKSWRDLIPVIKVDVSSGRVVFGNRLVPTTLSILVEEAHFVYSTKPAASRLDHFMHFAKCKAENFKVILAPSPKYTGMADDPPRYMGEGFVVLSSNNVELYYYMDEPGLVPEQPEMLQLANGDIVESAPPIWGMDIKCGKGTDFSYGPWADRQREHLFKFFFPQDCQPLKVTKAPLPGEKRMVQSFDIRLSTLHEATIDILFSKNKETNAVHVNVGPGSYLEMTMPWVVLPDGYTTKVIGQLLHLEATTSLTYRSLVVSETLEFTLRSRYPLKWNGHQEWLLHLTGCKASVWFIYAHKEFFQDMVNDWSSKARPDLLHFIPYTWRITLLLKEFEFILPCNEYNWVDCSSQSQENMCIAFCGELFDFSFDLPFVDFLPATLPLRFWIQGESMDLSMYLPEVFTSQCIVLALDQNARLLGRDGSIIRGRLNENSRKWRNKCQRSNGWLDCWSVPIVALSINYTYHPMPPYGPPPQADITTPEKEEILLSPMRIPRSRKSPALHHWRQQSGCPKFDPTTMSADKVTLDLEIGPSVLLVYGSWIRGFVNLKENIFGDDQVFTDMNEKPEMPANTKTVDGNTAGDNQAAGSDDDNTSCKDFDPREFRPLEVVVSITMHDIQAHLVKNCNENDPPCPIILLERFGFEMKKGYKETQLQLLLSPAILLSSDKVTTRTVRDRHLNQGHLMLSGLQLRGQAMFSDEGRNVDQETLEYAWLLEIQLGRLTGKMTTPQLHHLVTSLETLLLLTTDCENQLVPPRLPSACHHGLAPVQCPDSDPDGSYRCPSADQIKYRMVRVAIDAIDLHILESGTAINVYAAPIRFSTCNLHGNQVKSGLTGVLPCVRVRQLIAANHHFGHTTGGGSSSNTNTTGSGRSQHGRSGTGENSDLWLEVGSISLGPLIVEAAVSLSSTDRNLHLVQHKYLKTHDEKSKRLWFLWTNDKTSNSVGKCGCIGGCVFFGQNRNGKRFFKPNRQDATDGINIAAFRINDAGKDPGFGQSILHEAQLVFHTPPYNSHDVSIHDTAGVWVDSAPKVVMGSLKAPVDQVTMDSPHLQTRVERSRSVTETNKDSPVIGSRLSTATVSPVSCVKTSLGRRFSYTSCTNSSKPAANGQSKDVPYARLLDASPTTLLPPKLDSDSRLHATRSILSVPEAESAPKSSVSDSKLAVDYFNTTAQQYNALVNSVNCPSQPSSAVISSESDHSLGRDEALVERTVSICSENQSEAFFSAEEELSGGQAGVVLPSSRSSSLRHSLGIYRHENGNNTIPKKRFGSDMSIVAGTGAVAQSAVLDLQTSRLSSHRSDHEIHTPEHRSNVRLEQGEDQKSVASQGVSPLMRHVPTTIPRSVSPRFMANGSNNILGLPDSLEAQEASTMLLDSSDTHSVSSTSFISAVSSQEDLALVNLHMQVNKPIVESPLLMSSYVNHLSQVGCSNWALSSLPQGSDAFTVPLFQRTSEGKLVYIGSKYTPRFETLVEGFTSLKMITRDKETVNSPAPPSSKTPTHPYNWEQVDFNNTEDDSALEAGVQEELLSLRNESGTRTTLVVKMKGDIDIMVSPLVLESLQRFIDALTPTLVGLHPLSVLNHLHLSCIQRVEAANVLKRDQYLSQLTGGGSKRSTAERAKLDTQPHNIYEECIATQIQGTVILPKVNFALLQASVVEEVISFSALDNLRDLTCVSLLAVSFEGITARFHCGKQAREVVQTFHRPTVLPSGQKKTGVFAKGGKAFLLGHQTAAVTDVITGEPVYIETSEKQQEESVITLRINKVHTQLRRLRNESTILKDAVITAIPSHCSRVMFTTCSQLSTQPQSRNLPDSATMNSDEPAVVCLSEDKLGFIMFECGLEGVSIKVVKRSKFDKEEDEIKNVATENETNYTDSVRSKDDIEVSVVNEVNKSSSLKPEEKSATHPETPGNVSASAGETNQPDPSVDPAASSTQPSAVALNGKNGNASSCVIEVRQVWFNFAAPPRAPITRKIDFTRLDWNLLSTVSPAINAWMNPSNRFAIRVVHMLRCRYHRRCTAIVTCLMAEALDMQGIHMPIKSRYGRFTPLSKTLQEDPSCQLCTVLQKYLLQTTTNIEDNLHETDLPHLSTLRQGVIVLSRQWKNILYTPLLLEHNFKSKHLLRKPMNVTFAIPDPDEENVLTDGEGEGSGEECEVTDECAMLLNAEGGSTLHKVLKATATAHKHAVSPAAAVCTALPSSVNPGASVTGVSPAIAIHSPAHNSPHHLTPLDSLVFSSPTSPNSVQQPGITRKRSLLPSHPPSSSRASIVFPLLSGTNPFLHHHHRRGDSHGDKGIVFGTGYSTLKEDHKSHSSHHSLVPDSQPSIASLDNQVLSPGTYQMPVPGPRDGEDLYTWMAKHQDFVETANDKIEPGVVNKAAFWPEPKIETEGVGVSVTPGTHLVNPDYLLLAAAGYSLYPMHDNLRLLDAHLIFEPLLSSLGVMPQQMISNAGSGNNSLDSWGSNLSLVGGMEAMRIDIVVSEYGKPQDKRPRTGPKNAGTQPGKLNKPENKFWLELPPETPAFVCERVGVELELCRVADMTIVEDLSRQRRNMLYVSRGQLKKHSSTALNLSVSVRYIAQQVNMPLLRLLHQISNMYQNVKETQSELREQQPDSKVVAKTPPAVVSGLDMPEMTLPLLTTVPDLEKTKLPFPHSPSESKPIISPSSSVRSRHTSFAQRLRSTGKSVKGYLNLGEATISAAPGLMVSKEEVVTPRCWKTVYYLLDLYATMPETKTIAHSRFSVGGDVSEGYKGNKKYDILTEVKSNEDIERGEHPVASTPIPPHNPREFNLGEKTRLVVMAVAKIHRTRLLATLSGLKLEAEITNLHSSLTVRKKTRPASLECSLTGHVGRTMIILLEGVAPNQQMVVKVTVGKSQALYSSVTRRGRDKNSGLLTIGAVAVDIPQHPVALHGMMTRGSKQLSSTLQELRVTRTSSRMSRGTTVDDVDSAPQQSPGQTQTAAAPEPPRHQLIEPNLLLQPLVMQFSVVLQSLSITAALLPSLQAQYKMDQVTSTGVTGSKAKFIIDLPHHSLSFSTKVQVTEANLPSEASIELPKVHVSAEYVLDGVQPSEGPFFGQEGVVLRHGNYISAVADIGTFEHSLTTDLLNHLVFVQKVFMKEVNEVVQKVYGGEKPVPLWFEDSDDSSNSSTVKQILFTLVIRIKRIQLTATTPTNCAVRLETGAVDFQLSNRVQNVSGATQPNAALKIFGKAQVDVNLSLGQLIRNVLFEEAEPEFQQFAFFKTRIVLRNAFQGEMVGSGSEDKEVVLITLKRPLIYIQPMAVDKAILVWLNYKNAYEYWTEQRSSLNKEVLTATQQVFEKVPFEKLSTPHLGTLFLQLTVEDMGICVPLNPLPPQTTWGVGRQLFAESESCAAVVVTLESTSISACSSGSLVSKGRFSSLCLRFADDFETSLDDWKPDTSDTALAMNLCVVSEGTYEVCSRTVAAQRMDTENAKWFLNVQWAMEGVDIHLDVNVGKQLSALGHTLTTLTSVQEDEAANPSYDSDDADTNDNADASQESILLRRGKHFTCDSLPAFALDPSLDSKSRSKLIEKEMYEQSKIINDLRALGASHGTIEQEMKRLRELEAMIFKDFRRDMIQRLRRQSVKSANKNKTTFRSRSFIVPSPTPEHQIEIDSPDETAAASITSGSFDSSPRSGPSRSASLRASRGLGAPRVTFSDAHNITSASSELSLPVEDWTADGLRSSLAVHKNSFDSTDGSTLLLVEPEKEHSTTSPLYSAAPTPTTQKPVEPNIDFELDVKVLINRGKCVLHTKDLAREEDLKLMNRMKKERSCSGGMFEFPPSSPNLSRRSQKDRHHASTSSNRLRHLQAANMSSLAQLVDLTIFHIPGLDVKVHYESKTLLEDEEIQGRKAGAGTKKASLFAWTTLQSIPEETIISPHILEFLEQTLEPIPTQGKSSPFASPGPVNAMFTISRGDDVGPGAWVAGTSGSQYAYASFPVDVIVYFHMQPSTFRFSCLPVSRVECMLQLPSLDIVFSSKRAETEPSGFGGSTTTPSAIGGLSVTGCLADFSVYIFHPYGGKKTGLKETQWSPLADSERKDSLSVNVEFVKFHLSRSRKLNIDNKSSKSTGPDQSQAIIRFSTIIDIGSASFKYDMRRLTEILAFPKAWYRRSIVRRLFLGDFTTMAVYSEEDSSPDQDIEGEISESSPMLGPNRDKLRLNLESDLARQARLRSEQNKRGSSSGSPSPTETKTSSSTWETLVLFAVNFKRLNVHMNMGNVMGNVMWLTKNFRSEGRLSIGSTGHKNMFIGLGLGGSSLEAKGGIVGGTIELSKIDTFVLIREDPGMEPDHTVGLKLFALELRLDYMGTGVLMCRVSSLNVSLRDEWKMTNRKSSIDVFNPTRRPAMIFMHGDLGWDQLQLMISKSTTVDLLKMYYKLDEFFSQQFKSSKRVFSALGNSRNKTNSNSGGSSSSFRKRSHARKKPSVGLGDRSTDGIGNAWVAQDAKHHRHWQRVLAQVAGLHLSTVRQPLPASGTVLGGTMELHGQNISLACFHGINFKSKSWALFSLKEPCISFATEAQEVHSNENAEALDVHIVQTLTFSLGLTGEQPHAPEHQSMATVCKVSRNVLFPPQFRTLQEWFHYAFSCSDIDEVDRFPSVERERAESSEGGPVRSRTPKQDPNHTREVIFALPSLQLHLKTEHWQAASTPDASDEKPMVECSFVTEFEDHIFVTVDAEAFFFLHDLIISYIREKDRVMGYPPSARAQSPELAERRQARTDSGSGGEGTSRSAEGDGTGDNAANLSEEEKKRKSFEHGEVTGHTKDWRNYHCKTWHLEPTVRLLSWGGKSIEPYGVDYILQKLGFSHARTTIPKWMQRGFMDPLDKVLAVLVLRMVQIIREDPKIAEHMRQRRYNGSS